MKYTVASTLSKRETVEPYAEGKGASGNYTPGFRSFTVFARNYMR
jgi:hypothetical protein